MANEAKHEQLVALSAQILADNVCPDLAAQATQLVFGTGNPDADIVFIGEAPGKKEDETGEPFVGAAGKFLNEMLASISLERQDIYITNIVKYRPPNNRDPLLTEKQEFLPYLEKQLEIINPKIIVTLGRHSMNSLLPGLKISEVHGHPQRIKMRSSLQVVDGSSHSPNRYHLPNTNYFEAILLPLYHPAAALYNGNMRKILIADFAAIPTILETI